MDPEGALEVILDEKLPELHKMARELLRDQLISIYFIEKCPLYMSLMNTAERLHRNSYLSVPLAITEAIHLTPQTDMIQGPNDQHRNTQTAKMEDLSESE